MTTLTSRELNQDLARAKREAKAGPVFITDRGEPAFVLMDIDDYRRLAGTRRTLAEALAMPDLADVDFEAPKASVDLRVPDFD